MAKAEEFGKKETQRNITMHLGNLPRDLLQRFMSSSYHFSHTTGQEQEAEEEEEEIELSLGLSLNGRFGVDPRAKKLKRSSSIPDFINNLTRRESNEHGVFPKACGSLMRTCSLPTETEEEWRKRKELQSLRRMEAMRKRSEKQKNLRGVRDRRRRGGFDEENCEDKREEVVP
ncbi:ninja-family protein AFP1-like [Hibiscus syriacus]|uniref:ninja-family protein AFP1-like n=1 Tax=Hibiscus syriacus TaxID=106335 RepID=UPI00192090DD|nr:ninja-family protein AFP1-like [Hibiscus syriacus]